MALTFRDVKGSPLTSAEADENIRTLEEMADNKVRTIYFDYQKGSTFATMVAQLNAVPAFTIEANEIPLFIGREVLSGLGTLNPVYTGTRIKYLLKNKGKGTYGGSGGGIPVNPITVADLEEIQRTVATATDIENDPNTVIYDLGAIVFSNFLTLANEEEHDFSDTDFIYFFSYTIDGVLYLQQFIGPPGVYGDAGTQFVEADFTAGPTDVVPGAVPSWDDTLQVSAETTIPQVTVDESGMKIQRTGVGQKIQKNDITITEAYEDPVANVTYTTRAKDTNQEYAFMSDIKEDLPGGFMVFCVSETTSGLGATSIMYTTDTERFMDVEQYTPGGSTGNPASVEIIGNCIHLQMHRDSGGIRRHIHLKLDCRIVDNVLEVIDSQCLYLEAGEMPTATSSLHAEAYADGFLYYSTKTADPTQILKINAANVLDYKIITLASPANGRFHNIEVYKNWLYFLYVDTGFVNNFVGRIDTSFLSGDYEVVFRINQDATKRTSSSTPFVIYQDHIYMTWTNSTDATIASNNLGFSKYTMSGKLVLSNSVDFGTALTTNAIIPHWLTAVDGCLVCHTATSSSINGAVLRVRTDTLEFDGANSLYLFSTGQLITDDNTVSPDRKLYLNAEVSTPGSPLRQLYVFDSYKNLSSPTTSVVNYFSGGSTPTRVQKEGLVTKLSQLENDINSPTIVKNRVTPSDGINVTTANQIFKESGVALPCAVPIPANTNRASYRIFGLFNKPTDNGVWNVKLWRGTAFDVVTPGVATQIGFCEVTAGVSGVPFTREIGLKDGTMIVTDPTTSQADMTATGLQIYQGSYDHTVDQFVFFTATLGSASDTVTMLVLKAEYFPEV